jgi:hypothetical protein
MSMIGPDSPQPSLQDRFTKTRTFTEELASPLAAENDPSVDGNHHVGGFDNGIGLLAYG